MANVQHSQVAIDGWIGITGDYPATTTLVEAQAGYIPVLHGIFGSPSLAECSLTIEETGGTDLSGSIVVAQGRMFAKPFCADPNGCLHGSSGQGIQLLLSTSFGGFAFVSIVPG